MSSTPLVSIVLSCHDAAATLNRCLQSVANQTYTNWEIICVDDGSRDQTRDVLIGWQEKLGKSRLQIILHPEALGLTKSLNESWRRAQGELLARIDADDWWVSNKLAQQVAYLQANPDCGLVGAWYINVRGSTQHLVKLPATHQGISRAIFHANPFGHSCVLIRASLLEIAGGYDDTIRYGQDWDLWLRLWSKTTMANIPQPLCLRQVGSGLSTQRAWQQNIQALKTAHRYIRRYKQPFRHYAYLWVFVASAIAPVWLKKIYANLAAH